MPTGPLDARHQTHANLDLLWDAGVPQVLPVDGTPWCEIRLDPALRLVQLRTDYGIPAPDVSRLRNFAFEAVADGESEIAELTIRVDDNVRGAYGLVTSIADELQLAGSCLSDAVGSGVARFRDVLAPRTGLSESQEVGLFGELLFIQFLARVLGPGPAVNAWQGAMPEEHDFVFADLHIEVKTTSTERRRHSISSLSQLVPLPDVPLSLLSIQLTRGSTITGRTLSEAVARARSALNGYRAEFDSALEFRGWHPDTADLYDSRWVLRSAPRAYRVDAAFPHLTPSVLASVVPDYQRVSHVSYRVDVTDLDHHTLPGRLAGFAEQGV